MPRRSTKPVHPFAMSLRAVADTIDAITAEVEENARRMEREEFLPIAEEVTRVRRFLKLNELSQTLAMTTGEALQEWVASMVTLQTVVTRIMGQLDGEGNDAPHRH